MAKLHVVDGTWELFRHQFSKRPPHPTPDGRDFKAVHGIVSSLLGMINNEGVTHIAVAFDNPIESFRNRLFDGYKTSDGVPPELLAQFDPAEEGIEAIGVPVWSMDEWECDDALATASVKYRGDFEQIRILSPDKDLGQCLTGTKVVQFDRLREKEWTEETVLEVRGVPPKAVPDLLALIGDDADGIPGLAGFGAKTAAALLRQFGSIEAIPADETKWAPAMKPTKATATLAATLAEHRADALLYKKLATLVFDVPLKESADDLRWRGVPRARFEAWCDAIGSQSLKERPKRWQV
jgi:5'-3' exonuclease